jgi:UDP-glucuronate decarboxylase
MLILIAGGNGFIGTNLAIDLIEEGHSVLAVDNFATSTAQNVEVLQSSPNYELLHLDITSATFAIDLFSSKLLRRHKTIDQIYNLACPASPPHYQALSLETITANTTGLINLLEVARQNSAKFLQSSTSEVYGDPGVHPQPESYWGNVNTLGPRSCYDEGKRLGETICFEYQRKFKLDIKLVRIFNTYGPYMDKADGRVVSNFINQALAGSPITIYGDGKQTRSFQYISDLIAGFKLLMEKDIPFQPVNLGNPDEFTMSQLANKIIQLTGSNSRVSYLPLPQDDPKQRNPDISRARKLLNWQPKVDLEAGLKLTIDYFSK